MNDADPSWLAHDPLVARLRALSPRLTDGEIDEAIERAAHHEHDGGMMRIDAEDAAVRAARKRART